MAEVALVSFEAAGGRVSGSGNGDPATGLLSTYSWIIGHGTAWFRISQDGLPTLEARLVGPSSGQTSLPPGYRVFVPDANDGGPFADVVTYWTPA